MGRAKGRLSAVATGDRFSNVFGAARGSDRPDAPDCWELTDGMYISPDPDFWYRSDRSAWLLPDFSSEWPVRLPVPQKALQQLSPEDRAGWLNRTAGLTQQPVRISILSETTSLPGRDPGPNATFGFPHITFDSDGRTVAALHDNDPVFIEFEDANTDERVGFVVTGEFLGFTEVRNPSLYRCGVNSLPTPLQPGDTLLQAPSLSGNNTVDGKTPGLLDALENLSQEDGWRHRLQTQLQQGDKFSVFGSSMPSPHYHRVRSEQTPRPRLGVRLGSTLPSVHLSNLTSDDDYELHNFPASALGLNVLNWTEEIGGLPAPLPEPSPQNFI